MRDSLFHGKRIDNGEWVEGSLITTTAVQAKAYIVDSCCCTFDKVDCDGCALFDWISAYEVDPETVGQFTGLTAKEKKIFEGDIGRYKQTDGAKRNGKPITCIGKVVYNAKTASFAVESKDETGCKYFDYFPIKDFEVIGNIHDNPELLEVNGDA